MEILDRDIRRIREELNYKQGAEDRAKALEQRTQDLEAMKQSLAGATSQQDEKPGDQASQSTRRMTAEVTAEKTSNAGAKASKSSVRLPLEEDTRRADSGPSPAELEWERQKQVENARNDAIDTIMSLTGLEDVKNKILAIKAKTDASQRQRTDMKKERLGMVMLGNPGTGRSNSHHRRLANESHRQNNSGETVRSLSHFCRSTQWIRL